MNEIKTIVDACIERRNIYTLDLADRMANVVFFTKRKDAAKKDTQERVDAINSLSENQIAVKNRKLLIESFDEIIKKERGAMIDRGEA